LQAGNQKKGKSKWQLGGNDCDAQSQLSIFRQEKHATGLNLENADYAFQSSRHPFLETNMAALQRMFFV